MLEMHVMAQIFHLSDLHTHNKSIINPAFIGSDEALKVTLQYRNQWTGFPDAPKNTALTFQAPINNDKTGLGFMMLRNTFGIYKETSFMGNYAFRKPIKNGIFAMGIGFGLTAYHITWDDLEATDPDDIVLNDNRKSAILPDFSIGFCYYTRKYFIGFSLPFFVSHVSDENTGKLHMQNVFSQYNYFITGGYEFSLSETTDLLPSAVIRYQPDAGSQTDIMLRLVQWDRIGVGAGYRTSKMWIGQIDCKANDQLSFIYSYDSNFGKTGTYKGGSHEIMIGYVFRYKREVMGPRNF
jgi:type IX secretion system PorP/SprF family membrane protein